MTTNENPAAVRVCAIADIQCSRGCGTGACKREQPAAAPTHSPECEYIKTDNPWAACTCGIGSPNNPAPSPADGRAAFEAALDKRAKSAGFEVGRMTECELDNAWWGWQAARAASANETGAEGTDAFAHEVWSAAQRAPGEGIEDAVQRVAAILSRSPAMAAEAVAIPAGRKIVPVEPTQEMVDAGDSEFGNPFDACSRDVWDAMLATAPQPAQADARDEDAYVAKRLSETLASVYATIIGDDQVDENDGLNAIQRCERAAQVLRLEVELYRGQADARVRLTADERNALNEAVKQLPSISAMRTLRDKILAAHQDQPEPRAEVTEEQPSLTNPLTPYGMLCRALRIVTGTLLYDMAKHMRMSPSTLSAMEFGRRPVTYTDACGAADFFEERGIPNTLPALQRAIDTARAGEKQ